MPHRVRLAPPLDTVLPTRAGDAWRAVEALEVVRELARSRTTDSSVVRIPGFGLVVRKRWRWPRAGDRAKGAFRTTVAARSPARREADALRRLRALPAGPFAPEPLGVLEDRASGVLRACTLLAAEVEGAVDLAHWLIATPPGDERRAVLEDLARRTRSMHDAGLLDRDFHPRNVLVLPRERRTLKVDCPKQAVRSGRRLPAAQAALDLAALDVGLARLATPRERARFLLAYLGPERAPHEVRSLCRRVEALRVRIEPREARRLLLA